MKTNPLTKDNSQLMVEDILSDNIIRKLQGMLYNLYILNKPKITINENGYAQINWIDEDNDPRFLAIKDMIEYRVDCIKRYYQ